MFQIQLFGVLSVTNDDETLIAFPTNKVRALLAYLLMQGDEWIPRSHLATLLWEEAGTESAQKNLRNTLSRLRQSLGNPSWLKANRQAIQVSLSECALWIDVTCFDELWQKIELHPHDPDRSVWMEKAVALYRDDFLHSLLFTEGQGFESWRLQKQEVYHARVMSLLERLGEQALADGHFNAVEQYARRQLTMESWQERAHRQLIRALAAMGEHNRALAQFEICRKTLFDELRVEPDGETLALVEQIRNEREHGAQPSRIYSPAALPILSRVEQTQRSNLTTPLTPFVGREREVAQLCEALQAYAYRLHVIVGMGGMGKSRLALQVAAMQLDHFKDGVFVVALPEVSTVSELLPAIADVLKIPLQDKLSLHDQVAAYLKNRHLLLLLDNAEHLLGEGQPDANALAVQLLELLQQAQQLVLMVTSRRQLSIRAENLFMLEGLAYPPAHSSTLSALQNGTVKLNGTVQPNGTVDSADYLQYDAIQLFVEQARRVKKDFSLQDEVADVAQICQLLEGMPLAIELAAAQVQHSNCATLVALLSQNLVQLQSEFFDAPQRQRSLLSLFDYSWRFLSAQQQQLLARCAIFQGGFAHTDLHALFPDTCNDDLAALVFHSLLQQPQEDRYRFHALVQQCAVDQQPSLQIDSNELADSHGDYFLNKIGQLTPAFYGEQLPAALAATAQEWANLHAAWYWALDNAHLDWLDLALDGFFAAYYYRVFHEQALSLWATTLEKLGSLYATQVQIDFQKYQHLCNRLRIKQTRHYLAMERIDEGQKINAQVLDGGDLAPAVEMEAQLLDVWLHPQVIMTNRARLAELSQIVSDFRLQGEYRRLLASERVNRGEFADGYETATQAIDCYRSCGDVAGHILSLFVLATSCMHLGKLDEARSHLEIGLQAALARQDLSAEKKIHEMSGIVYSRGGDHSAALHAFTRAVELNHQLGQPYYAQMMMMNLALEYSLLGQYVQARQIYESVANTIFNEQPDIEKSRRRDEFFVRMNLGLLLHTIGEQEEALLQSKQALQLCKTIQLTAFEGYVQTNLGYIFSALDRWQEAEDAYQSALALRQRLGETVLVLETHAGLARLAMAQGDLLQAQQWIEPILTHLQSETLDGAEEPLRAYLTCYTVLHTLHDPRASWIAQEMHCQLQQRAKRISDPELRQSFLNQVPYHRDILEILRTNHEQPITL